MKFTHALYAGLVVVATGVAQAGVKESCRTPDARYSGEETAQIAGDDVLGNDDQAKESCQTPVPGNPVKKTKVVLVGDSTVTDSAGWGAAFARLAPGIECVNLARGGQSSKSFRETGWWQKALDAKPDYVLIQFGHNDMPGKGPNRETDPATTYREFLGRYIDEARAVGATPILVTSVVRRNFNAAGKIVSSLAPYADAARAVAKEKQAPLVDLHESSLKLMNEIGPEAAAAMSPPHPTLPGKLDGTHLNATGADRMARLVIQELIKAEPSTKSWFEGEEKP